MATNTSLSFKRGLLSKLPATYENGTFYVTTDERALYLDISDTERIRLGDFQEYTNWAAIQALEPKDLQETALYYAKAENILAQWDKDGGWKQINPDTYVGGVTVTSKDITSGLEAGATGTAVTTTVTNAGGKSTSATAVLNVIGKGTASVSTDANGNLVITGIDTNTDTKVTSASNHYDPTQETTSVNAASTGDGFVTGIITDGKGHIKSLTKSAQQTNSVTEVNVGTSGNNNQVTVTTTISQNVGGDKAATFNVVGAGATTVSQANKTLTITSTDSKVTSVENHYEPVANGNALINIENNKIIREIRRDAAGHVTSVDVRDENDLASVSTSATGQENKATVTTTVATSAGTSKAATFDIVGAGATKVSVADNTVTITSTNTDESTTETGHYTPSIEDSGKKMVAESGTVVSGIKVDSKNHIIGIETAEATKVSDTTLDAATITNGARLTSTIKSNNGQSVSDTLDILGNDATTVSVNDKGEVVISSTDKSVSDVGHHYKTKGVEAGTIVAKNGKTTDAKDITQVLNGITIDGAGHVTNVTSVGIADTHANIDELTISYNNVAGFDIKVKDTDSVSKTATLNPVIKYGKNADQSASFIDGIATLDVLTKAEIENEIGNAIANTSSMVLRGELNASEGKILPTSNIAAGDTYLVTGAGTYEGQYAEAGDLFVAKEDGLSEWYYVPSGNDVTKIIGVSTLDEKGFYLTEGDEDTATVGSKVLFENTTNIVPTVLVSSDAVKVSFNMVWGEF